MKPIHALAVLGALATGPALAQQSPSADMSGRPDALVLGVELPDQAIQPQFLAQIQQQLKSQGYYQGPVDGIYGNRTQSALAAWQRDQGLEATGQLNAQTIAAMDTGSSNQMPQQAERPDMGRDTSETGPQQARNPASDAVEIEQFNNENMSAPNVEGESVPERPGTGAAAPQATPEQLRLPSQE